MAGAAWPPHSFAADDHSGSDVLRPGAGRGDAGDPELSTSSGLPSPVDDRGALGFAPTVDVCVRIAGSGKPS